MTIPILSYLSPCMVRYIETDAPIEKIPTDSYTLAIEEVEGQKRYVCQNGMVFSIEKNEPDAFLGWLKEGVLHSTVKYQT